MLDKSMVIEETREHLGENRRFFIHYQLERKSYPNAYSMKATLMEQDHDGQVYETISCVELPNLDYRVAKHLLSAIHNAPEPVFPAHLPDIARDLASQIMSDCSLPEEAASP